MEIESISGGIDAKEYSRAIAFAELSLLEAAMEAAAWSEETCARSADVCSHGSLVLSDAIARLSSPKTFN